MELTFPFKNLALNNLIDFFEIQKIKEFYKGSINAESTEANNLSSDIEYYRDRLPDFENEILQLINTSNQETINKYFEVLRSDLRYLKEESSEDKLLDKVIAWNDQALKDFDHRNVEREEQFAKDSNHERKHLEQYEEYVYDLFAYSGEQFKKVTKTNYNYNCIEEILELIDPNVVINYRTFLNTQIDLFREIANKYGRAWSNGEIKSKELTELLKPILFCEGDIDISLINKGAILLNRTNVLSKIEIRHRGSCSQLDKLWNILTNNNWKLSHRKNYSCMIAIRINLTKTLAIYLEGLFLNKATSFKEE